MNLHPLLETLKRPGLLGLVGQRVEKRMRQALESYFQILGRRIAGLNLETLPAQSKEVIAHMVEMRTHNTLRILTPLLKAALEIGIQDAMLKSNSIHHFSEAEDDDPLTEEVPMITSEEAALYASIHAGELVGGINDTTQSLIADAVQKGIDENLGVDGTARLIRQVFQDMTIQRSRTIATTEMADAMSEAMMRKLDRLGIEYKRWILSPEACEICEDNAAQGAIPIDDEFDSGDERPPAHPNCLSGLELVTATGVAAASKRWFEGKVLSVRVASDHCIILTKNHPVLTPRGWVAAGELKQGAELIQSLDPRRFVSRINPNDHLVESLLEEIPHTVGMSSGAAAVTMPLTAEDFHGDVSDRKVDVVFTAGSLVDEGDISSIEYLGEFEFAPAHRGRVKLSRSSALGQGPSRLLLPTNRGVGSSRHSGSFARALHSHAHKLAASTNRQPMALERSHQAASMAPDLPSNIFRSLSGLIAPVKIVEICEHDFRDHVYNLQTDCGYYLANAIVTHNCRCAVVGAREPVVQ